jgi:glucose/arabinose dehydrogenase
VDPRNIVSSGAALIGRLRRARGRRTLSVVAGGVIASSMLTGCHGPPHAQAVATGLETPAAFTLDHTNAGRIWYSERFSGEIRRLNISSNPPQNTLVWTVPNVVAAGEQGLFGLALHPNYPTSPFLYAFATRNVSEGPRNQVLKISLNSSGIGTQQQVILNDVPAGSHHNGGRIKFGPDGLLYVSIGEHGVRANAQDLNNLAGKVLRNNASGGVPADNPFPGKPIWAFGIRNSFGFNFDPLNGHLWLTDNGPECNDEVNRIIKGGNYAWGPNATCSQPPPPPDNTNQNGPLPRLKPRVFYGSPIAPTGLAFCDGCGLGSGAEDKPFFGAVNNGHIHQLTLNAARDGVASDAVVYDHGQGVLAVESRAGQPIYFSDFTAIYKLTVVG